MKVKKYRASTMPEAMKLIRSDLGNEAIILNSRVIQSKGFFGFLKKRSIEVIAALDEMSPEQVQQPVNIRKEAAAVMETQENKETKQETEELRKEILALKELLLDTAKQMEKEEPVQPAPIQYLEQLLCQQEINKQFIAEITAAAFEWYKANDLVNTEREILLWAKEYMAEKIAHMPFSGMSHEKKFITVVGPTGVGKTTTLAKMAADAILTYKKKIAFITTDTYRIAAIEQLKTYANILKAPLEVCYNREDFQLAVNKLRDYDAVFIDTAGRNFRNPAYVADLKRLIDFNNEMETFLVLSLTTKQMDMEEVLEQFKAVDIDKLILTKADETSVYGAIFNLLYSWKKPVAYITNGQNVPDDIVVATAERIVDQLLGVNEHE